jgi:hypothetical protein
VAEALPGFYNHYFTTGPQITFTESYLLCININYDIHLDDYEVTLILMSYVSANLYCKQINVNTILRTTC